MWGTGDFHIRNWHRNSNNDCGKKGQGFAGDIQQNERTYIGVLQGVRKYKKIESLKWDGGTICQWWFKWILFGRWC